MPRPVPRFPSDFVWGVSTASYQIEGAIHEGGRGPTSWDAFTARPGVIADASSGEDACDHYHRYPEDVALMRDLGVDAYRFSIAWSRIQPDGRGPANAAGLAFYDRLVDTLLEAGITPTPTLFHWDTPLALEDAGGWRVRDTAERLGEYAAIVAAHLGDRVPRWITINEPVVLTMLGYGAGIQAPGLTLGLEALPVAHHLLLGHGLAVEALRAAGAVDVGIASSHAPTWPASDSPEDVAAAGFYDVLANRLFADPVLLGEYPEPVAAMLPPEALDDLPTISAPLDFYGINYYNPQLVSAPDPAAAGRVDGHTLDADLPFALQELDGYPLTDFGWPVVPGALTELLVGFRDRYGDRLPPVVITENGCAINDGPGPDGEVHDQRRIDFTADHLAALGDAIDAGVDVRGYFHWSLLDNFEWAAGYTQRFGLVHVDYATQTRTPKDSFAWYRDVLAAQR